MGQVPSAKPWLLIGSGRLATHLATYLRQLGIPCRQWSRAHGWHGPAPTEGTTLEDGLRASDRVLLAISDDALGPFVARHRAPDGEPAIWIHFSGGRQVDGAWGVHPLCTFGPQPYAPDFYPTIPFLLEEGGPSLAELLPGLPNPSATLPAGDKPLYHALCVAAGNFTTLLWQRFFRELESRWGLDPALALPYLRRTVANLEAADPRGALTGPIARGDSKTVAANLAALDGAGLPDLARIYRAFLEARLAPIAESAA